MVKRNERMKKPASLSSLSNGSDEEPLPDHYSVSSNYGRKNKNNKRKKKVLRSRILSSTSRIKAKYSKTKVKKRRVKHSRLSKKESENTISTVDSTSQQQTKIILSQELIDRLSSNVTKSLMMLDRNKVNALKSRYKRKKIEKQKRRKLKQNRSKYSLGKIESISSHLKRLSFVEDECSDFNKKTFNLDKTVKIDSFNHLGNKLLEDDLKIKSKIENHFQEKISTKIKSFSRHLFQKNSVEKLKFELAKDLEIKNLSISNQKVKTSKFQLKSSAMSKSKFDLDSAKHTDLSKRKTPKEKISAVDLKMDSMEKLLALLKFGGENEMKMIKQNEKEIDVETEKMAFQRKHISGDVMEDIKSTLEKSTQPKQLLRLKTVKTKSDSENKMLTSTKGIFFKKLDNFNAKLPLNDFTKFTFNVNLQQSNRPEIEKTKKMEKVALKDFKILAEKLQLKMSKIDLQSVNERETRNLVSLSRQVEEIKSVRKSVISDAIWKNSGNSIQFDEIKLTEPKLKEDIVACAISDMEKVDLPKQTSPQEILAINILAKKSCDWSMKRKINEKFIESIKAENKEIIKSELEKQNKVNIEKDVSSGMQNCLKINSITKNDRSSTIKSNITSFVEEIKTVLTDVKEKKEYSKKMIPRISQVALIQNIKVNYVNNVNTETIMNDHDHRLSTDHLVDHDHKIYLSQMSLAEQMAQLKKMAFQSCKEDILNNDVPPKVPDKIIECPKSHNQIKQIGTEEKQSLHSFLFTSHEKIVHYNKLIQVPQVFSTECQNGLVRKENIKINSNSALLVKGTVQPSNLDKSLIAKEIIQTKVKDGLVQTEEIKKLNREKNLLTEFKKEKRRQLDKVKDDKSSVKQIKKEIYTRKEQSRKPKDQYKNI